MLDCQTAWRLIRARLQPHAASHHVRHATHAHHHHIRHVGHHHVAPHAAHWHRVVHRVHHAAHHAQHWVRATTCRFVPSHLALLGAAAGGLAVAVSPRPLPDAVPVQPAAHQPTAAQAQPFGYAPLLGAVPGGGSWGGVPGGGFSPAFVLPVSASVPPSPSVPASALTPGTGLPTGGSPNAGFPPQLVAPPPLSHDVPGAHGPTKVPEPGGLGVFGVALALTLALSRRRGEGLDRPPALTVTLSRLLTASAAGRPLGG